MEGTWLSEGLHSRIININCYTLYSLSVFFLAKSLRLLLGISGAYRLVSSDNWLVCGLQEQCIISTNNINSVPFFCYILNNKGLGKCYQSTLIIPGITKTPATNCLKFGSTQIIDGSAITKCRCSQLGCTEIARLRLLTDCLHQAMRWRSSIIFGWKFASTNQK